MGEEEREREKEEERTSGRIRVGQGKRGLRRRR